MLFLKQTGLGDIIPIWTLLPFRISVRVFVRRILVVPTEEQSPPAANGFVLTADAAETHAMVLLFDRMRHGAVVLTKCMRSTKLALKPACYDLGFPVDSVDVPIMMLLSFLRVPDVLLIKSVILLGLCMLNVSKKIPVLFEVNLAVARVSLALL